MTVFLLATLALAAVIALGYAFFRGRGGGARDSEAPDGAAPDDAPPLADGNRQIMIDVRTQAEFEAGHIEGALFIPYDVIGAQIGQHVPDKSRPILIYCHSGSRSGVARSTLRRMGYTNVVNGGGYLAVRRRLRSTRT